MRGLMKVVMVDLFLKSYDKHQIEDVVLSMTPPNALIQAEQQQNIRNKFELADTIKNSELWSSKKIMTDILNMTEEDADWEIKRRRWEEDNLTEEEGLLRDSLQTTNLEEYIGTLKKLTDKKTEESEKDDTPHFDSAGGFISQSDLSGSGDEVSGMGENEISNENNSLNKEDILKEYLFETYRFANNIINKKSNNVSNKSNQLLPEVYRGSSNAFSNNYLSNIIGNEFYGLQWLMEKIRAEYIQNLFERIDGQYDGDEASQKKLEIMESCDVGDIESVLSEYQKQINVFLDSELVETVE
jgi:hypothetical protein